MKKKTLVIGASLKPSRFSYLAIKKLTEYGHEVIAIGKREGVVSEVNIQKDCKNCEAIDTVTLYLNPINQIDYEGFILDLLPKRIIFNPGTENNRLAHKAAELGIEVVFDCTLVMLDSGTF